MKNTLLIAALLLPFSALADVPVYVVDKQKSSLKFFAIQNNAPVEGSFREFTADIRFDPANLEQSVIKAEVATASLAAANEDAESSLPTAEWLSVQTFPKASFVSKKITRLGQGDTDFIAEGELTIRDKSMPAVLNFKLKLDGNNAIADGYITVRRNDFGVGQGEWTRTDVIKNEVRVQMRIIAQKAQ